MAKKKTTTIESYTLKNGEKRYRFQVYLGIDPLTGKESRTTRSKFKTRKEAELALARIKIDVANGTFQKQTAETYQEVYNLWIQQYEKTVEESTFVKTTGIFRIHILPALGQYKIDKMNVDVCQRHVNEWSSKLKKFRAVKSYASKVMDFAIKRGFIQTNPFSLVDLPNNTKGAIEPNEEKNENFYSREQLENFFTCFKKESNYKAYTFFRLLAFSGMRKGEALALTWNDVNFKTNAIRISKAISRGLESKLYVKPTKTGIARTIIMDELTMSIMKEWNKKQKQEYLILGYNTMQPDQLVFSNDQNNYLQPTKPGKWLNQVL